MKSLRTLATYVQRKNYYEVLGVSPKSSQQQIKEAFLEKTKQLHPDYVKSNSDPRLGWSKTSKTDQFVIVKEAYDCLRNPEKRKAYDTAYSPDGGFLMEARAKTNSMTSQNAKRNEWSPNVLPGGKPRSNQSFSHFRNPEEEYMKEKNKNRMLVLIGVVLISLVLSNIFYVQHLRKERVVGSR